MADDAGIFREYLDEDWEFSDKWRAFVERLDARLPEFRGARVDLNETVIWEDPEPRGENGGLLLWLDLPPLPGESGEISLGATLDDVGLRCGTVSPHCPNDMEQADLSWLHRDAGGGQSLELLADEFAQWVAAQAALPRGELVRRRSEFVARVTA